MSESNIQKRRKIARKKWADLQESKRPLIYVGAGSCGLAAGAGEVIEAIKSYLEDKNLSAEIIRVGCIGPCYL
ncbi:MAG TPA: (2Fe-2S) ferredoxin domain-containing protein, partial [Desulfatiglandales bacterium]|nr:(2Fe-2S) ferredoxin domain-containing protein [Desulfatiglandales bacterium]